MNLLPILPTLTENTHFLNDPDLDQIVPMTVEFFDKIGYTPPWIGYVAQRNDQFVGSAAFKGAPKNGQVEIAYSVFPAYQQQGIGTEICHQLTQIALHNDPTVRITARTLPEENYSTQVLKKNGFVYTGVIWDDDDGDIWEWVYEGKADH